MKVRGAGGQIALMLLLGSFASACSQSSPATVALKSASVDSTYACPAGVDNAPYPIHATIELRNGTSSTVTIKSVAAAMTLAAVKGSWLERVGDKYEASGVTFTPSTVSAATSASLNVTIPSACTNGKTPSPTANYGEYSVSMVVTASSGTYTIESKNRHRIVVA